MKKNVTPLLLLVLIFSSCGTKKQFSFNRGGATQNFYYTTIPFEWIRNKIIVPVEINGKTYRFILDTGASNLISETLYNELNLPVLHKDLLFDQSRKKDSTLVVEMDNLTFGNVLFKNIPAGVISDSNPFFECFGVDGFIGSNMLRNSVVRFSLPNKTVTLTDHLMKLGINPKNSWAINLTPNQSLPVITIAMVNVNDSVGVTEDLLFDTGAGGFYSLCLRNLEIFASQNVFKQIASSAGSNTVGLFGNADNALQYKLLLPLMLINNASFTNVVLTTNSAENSAIGAEILKYGDVTLDYKNKIFNFEHFYNEEKNVYEKSFPFEPTYEDNKVLVGFVWDESLKNKISVGDRILFVDEADYKEVNPCDLLAKESILSNRDKVTLTIEKSDGSIHKIEIEKK